MAAAAGRKMIIKYDADGAGGSAAVEIAGARTDSLTIANTQIDITDKSDDGIRATLDDIGMKTVDISCSGILTDSTLFDLWLAAGDGTAHHYFEIDVIGLRTLTGTWDLASFEVTGEYEGATTFTASMTSTGTIASA